MWFFDWYAIEAQMLDVHKRNASDVVFLLVNIYLARDIIIGRE